MVLTQLRKLQKQHHNPFNVDIGISMYQLIIYSLMIISIHGQRVFNKNGKCLDIDGGITYARKAQLWQCNGAIHQTFQFVNDVIKIGGAS